MVIENSIAQFLHENGIVTKLGTIDLSWENGWGQKTYDILHALMEYQVEGTYSRSGSASSKRTTFTVKKDGEEYKVVYWTDSGD